MADPLLRREFDYAALLREHPPKFNHPHKAALFEMAYPEGAGSPGTLEVTQWAQHIPEPLNLSNKIATEVRPDFFDYRPTARGAPALEWHVNFADPRVFAAYGSRLFAQDEMQVAEHPLLACVREALLASGSAAKTVEKNGATPILVRNVERRLAIATNPDASAGRPHGIYGNRFDAAPFEVVRRATQVINPAMLSNILAMAAPAGGRGDYTDAEIVAIFGTAFTAFAAAVEESKSAAGPSCETVIHTGFWGCGAFSGNRHLMIAMQALAASAAGADQLILHCGDLVGVDDAERGLEVADDLAFRCGASCSLDKLVGRTAILGLQWGISDGN